MTDATVDPTPSGRIAAFFDLDKTVIAKSSALAFSKPFFAQGLLNRRAVLKSSYAQFLFMLSGADHDQVERMRAHIAAMCTGWDVEQIKAIVAETLHDIVDPLVFAEAADLIADHRLRGHDVIIVSASGEEVVTPIATALGATHSTASRMRIEDGRYAGESGVLLLRGGQGGGNPGAGAAVRVRSRTLLRVLGLVDGHPDVAGRGSSAGGEPGSGTAPRSSRK